LATRPLLAQDDRATPIETHDIKRVLTDIDTDHGDCGIELVRHDVLLVFGAPCQLRLLAGREHGRTIPLAVFAKHSRDLPIAALVTDRAMETWYHPSVHE
jgi:hypothetical protein